MRLAARIGAVLFVALCLSARGHATTPGVAARVTPSQADDAPPVIRMLTPRRIRASRFVALRVKDRASGLQNAALTVNGTAGDVGDLAAHDERLRVRARLGWEPRRRYRIRMTAADRAGNVRTFVRVIRPRSFGIVRLAVRNLIGKRAARAHAAGGCGYVHIRPR